MLYFIEGIISWMTTVLVQAAITNYHRLGRLNNKHIFLTVLKAGKFKIKVLTDLVSGESPLPGLLMAVFLLCPDVLRRANSLYLFL